VPAPRRLAAVLVAAAMAAAVDAPMGLATVSQAPNQVSAPAAVGSGQPPAASGVAPAPIAPSVHTFAVVGVSTRGLAVLGKGIRAAASTYAALSAPEPASGFAVTGATWTGPAPAGLELSIRTRTAGMWSTWTPMVFDADHGPTPGTAEARKARPGTDPFVVGAVDDVQLKAESRTGAAPAGLTLSVIDPGTSAADNPAVVWTEPIVGDSAPVSAESLVDPVAVPAATPMPTIYSRADWGADEGLRGCCVEYGEVHAGFVHHTVNSNNYTRAEVPAILRGIYAYHTQSRGWRDIGYNYLIDKFGRIWEGRYGGVTLPVVGAHTLNYNENSFAASAIGNYETAHPSSVMLDAYARLYAWKLSLHGVRPTSRQDVAGTMFNAISGHRDAAQTACPGIHLYNKIPDIIAAAQKYQHLYLGRDTYHSFVKDDVPDVLTIDRAAGQVSIARGTGPPGFEPPQVVTTDFAGRDRLVAVGDVTGDGLNDLMARSTMSGATQILAGNDDGTFTPSGRPRHKWAKTDLFAGPGDLNGDGVNDLVARDSGSRLLVFYRGRPSGGFAAGVPTATSLTGVTLLSAAGDFNGDGFADLLAHRANGRLSLYAGDGTGGFPTVTRLVGNWSARDLIAGGADLTGDGRPDVVARNATSRVTQIFANIDGARLSTGIAELSAPMVSMSLSRDLTGDRRPDVVTMTARGRLNVIPARRQNWLAPSRARSLSWPGMNRVFVVGDWNSDGYVDAMAREKSTGAVWLFPGRSVGGFGAPIGGWTGWGARSLIAPVGDFNGDGRPDLMARSDNGRVYLYPGRGDAGFKAPIIMRSSLPGADGIVGVGRWDGDGAPDVVVTTTSGAIQLYPGNGPGGLDDPVTIGRHADRYDTLVAVGDLTQDGQTDLVGRTPDGDLWLLAGLAPSSEHPSGAFAARQYLASGWSTYRLG
jgi:hypothetical protein